MNWWTSELRENQKEETGMVIKGNERQIEYRNIRNEVENRCKKVKDKYCKRIS